MSSKIRKLQLLPLQKDVKIYTAQNNAQINTISNTNRPKQTNDTATTYAIPQLACTGLEFGLFFTVIMGHVGSLTSLPVKLAGKCTTISLRNKHLLMWTFTLQVANDCTLKSVHGVISHSLERMQNVPASTRTSLTTKL